ncbi:MAG: hypothetical protein HUJ96_09740 [Marinilabiliaceae bacterium]|nr:hypothetical protein [Marinilabiliaceae bacterium]
MKKIIFIICALVAFYLVYGWFTTTYVLPNAMGINYESMGAAGSIMKVVTIFSSVISAAVNILFSAVLVLIGYYVTDKQSFPPILKATLYTDCVNVLASICKVVSILFISPATSALELNVMPCSLTQCFNIAKLENWQISLYNSVNIFFVMYIAVFAFFLSKILVKSYWSSLKVVLLSYGLVNVFIVVVSSLISYYSAQ